MDRIDTTPKKDYDLDQLIPKADAGDLQAQYDVLTAVVQTDDDNRPSDAEWNKRLVGYAQSLMDAEEPSGFFYMAQFCENDDVVERDKRRAAELYIRAGDLGAVFGYEYAGLLYYYGDGIERDYDKAFALISRGDESAMQPEPLFALAEMLRQGLGTEKNAEKANVLYISFLANYDEMINGYLECSQKMAEDLSHLFARVRLRLAEAFETGSGGLEKSKENAEEQIRSAVRLIVNEKADDRKFGIEPRTIYEAFARIMGIPMDDERFPTKLTFCEYLDFEDGQMALMETRGDLEVPVNVFAEEGSDHSLSEGDVCQSELYAYDFEVDVYESAEEVSKDTGMSKISMIPIGTFPLEPNNPDFKQNPSILFNGVVVHTAIRHSLIEGADDCEYSLFVTVETLEMLVTFELACDTEVKLGEYWHGSASLSAVIRKDDSCGDNT